MNQETRHFRLVIDGKDCFFKIPRPGDGIPQSIELLIQTEVCASKLARRILGELVVEASEYVYQNHRGIIQPYIEVRILQRDVTKPISFLPTLSQKQLEQLFVHMLCDWVLSNTDDNAAQFGLDSQANVIAFDKGESFKVLKARTLKAYLSDWVPVQRAFYEVSPDALGSVYGVLCGAIRTRALTISSQSSIIQDVLKKLRQLTREEVRECLGSYAILAIPAYEECLYTEVLKRAHSVASDVAFFFATI